MVSWDSVTQTYGTQSTLPFTGLSVPWAVTVDGNGNVYVSSSNSGTIEKLPWNSTTKSYGTQTKVVSGLGVPAGLAVDANGDVYVADVQNNRVAEIPWTGTGYGSAVTVVNSLSSPMSVALDGSGNLFVLNGGNVQRNQGQRLHAALDQLSNIDGDQHGGRDRQSAESNARKRRQREPEHSDSLEWKEPERHWGLFS